MQLTRNASLKQYYGIELRDQPILSLGIVDSENAVLGEVTFRIAFILLLHNDGTGTHDCCQEAKSPGVARKEAVFAVLSSCLPTSNWKPTPFLHGDRVKSVGTASATNGDLP
jgi:hypothetical protein